MLTIRIVVVGKQVSETDCFGKNGNLFQSACLKLSVHVLHTSLRDYISKSTLKVVTIGN